MLANQRLLASYYGVYRLSSLYIDQIIGIPR